MTRAVCRRHVRARAHAHCARPCGACSSCAPSCWACGALVQCSPDRAASARQRRRHRGGAPARALCWRCACLRRRACVSHARAACTCCACACCACLRCARLRFICSRCVHLLCVHLLCAFVLGVVCLCSARLHRADFLRQRRRHTFNAPQRPLMPLHGVPSCSCTCICRTPCPPPPCSCFNPLKTTPGHVVFGLDYSGLASTL